MKIIITIFLFGISSLKSYSQIENGIYKGLERMCWTNDKGKFQCYDSPRKWYHENFLLVENDSFFIYKIPFQLVGKKKMYSASDGAYYYYLGSKSKIDTSSTISLTSNNCDYCAHETKIDKVTGFMYPVARVENLKLNYLTNGVKIGNVSYHKSSLKQNPFPPKQYFYYDSNSIYRYDPKEQYKLISTGIKNFLQTKELKLENDTLRISIERKFDNNGYEKLNAENLKIDTIGITIKFYTRKEIEELTELYNRPIRYIEVGRITDYLKAARISLEYVISLPKKLHKFSERQLNNSFKYNKVGTEYILAEDLQENSWGLIEKK
jgi:hypothetical protein